MRSYEAPRVASIRISDMLTDLGPARANLYDGGCGDQCGGHDGGHGTDGWWW